MPCPTLHAFDSRAKIVAVLCGKWMCPQCARENARLWAWRCKIHIKARNNRAYFWTFTLRGKFETANEGYLALPGLWNRLRMRILRSTGKGWSYCAFVEGQPQRGYMPHFHVISMSKSPYRLKDLAMYSGFGYQADEKRINSAKAATYCAKYASKQNPKTPHGFRRVRASRDWAKLPPYTKKPLYIKAKSESTMDYLLRVAEGTDSNLQDVVDRWLDIGENVT
jgi:hypothetical protein